MVTEHDLTRIADTSGDGEVISMWRFTDCDLATARMLAITITGSDWSYVNLRQASLPGIVLDEVSLVHADLDEADLSGAGLRGANLDHANLRRANLAEADLRGASVDGAILDDAVLTGCRLDLAQAVALARARGAVVDIAG